MVLQEFAVTVQLMTDLLGTCPKNKSVYKTFIATKAPNPDPEGEALTIEECEEKGWTTFHKDAKGPFLYDYAVKGFLCEAARTLKTWGTIKQLQDKYKRYVFVYGEDGSRFVRLPAIDAEPLERPLRAMTAQGPRVTVTRSDVVKAGAKLDFRIKVIEGSGITETCLREVISYGELIGLGQWRSGAFGRIKLLNIEEV